MKGKTVVLDNATKDFDWEVTDELPAELKAGKPEEVGTGFLIDWNKRERPAPTRAAARAYYQYTANVTVVDHARRAVIGATSLTGGEPPHEISDHASEGCGRKPIKEIVGYLAGLPCRGAPLLFRYPCWSISRGRRSCRRSGGCG